MIRLEEFKNALQQLARPNRFLVDINPPTIYGFTQDLQQLKYCVQTAQIPAKTLGAPTMKFHGMELQLPGDYSHDDLTITFLNHWDWSGREFFENWSKLLQDVSSYRGQTEGFNTREDAIDMIKDSSIIVTQIGESEDQVLARYQFWDVFPKNISEIELNMEQIDTVETFQVTFAYSHSERLPITGTVPAGEE